MASCSEIFEEPIDDEVVALLSPGDGFKTATYLQTFLWEDVDDALYYRLQIASPGFDSPAFYAADSLVEGRRFTMSLDPGEYEWRVQALNGSSMTGFTSRKLTILSSSISNQTVQLLAPADKFLTAKNDLVFEWGGLFGAAVYRVQVDTNNFVSEENLLLNATTPNTRFSFTAEQERVYQWRVRAESDTAESKWSAGRLFTLDQTPPDTPVLTSPANNGRVDKPVNLQWNAMEGAVGYRLFVYKSDSTTLFNSDFPVSMKATTYSFNLGDANQRIYWRVSAVDAAGNESQASLRRNFILNP